MRDHIISFGVSGACKGSTAEANEVGCNTQPTHLERRTYGGVRVKGSWVIKPRVLLVAWCCECYRLEGGEDCSWILEEEEE